MRRRNSKWQTRMPDGKSDYGLKSRKIWIDGLRGLAMILVLYGHFARGWTEFFVYTSAIKIPLFFAITGYVFKVPSGSLWQFVRNIVIKIGIPWVVLTLMPIKIGYQMMETGIHGALQSCFKYISSAAYWYMPCCIVAEIIFFCILKYAKKNSYITAIVIVISTCGFILARAGIGRFAEFRVACIAQIFMLYGFLFRYIEEDLMNNKFRLMLELSCIIIYLMLGVLTSLFYPGQCMDVHVCRYYNLPMCLSMIMTGLLAVFFVFRKNYTREGVLSFIGKNTLVFYMIGAQCKGVTITILKKIGIILPENPFTWAFLCTIICLECTVASIVLNQWMPEFVGKSRRKE